MATTAPATEAALSTVHETARHSLAAALSEASSEPAASPAPSPAPQTAVETLPVPPPAAAESPSAQPAAPVEGSPPSASPSPITIDPATLSPEAQRFLAMKGGDVNRALADALEYNNRLGKNPPAEAPAESLAPPVPEPPAPVVIEPAVIETRVAEFLAKDQQSAHLVSQYQSIDAEFRQARTQQDQIKASLAEHKAWLKLPEIANEPFRKAEMETAIRTLESDNLLLQLRQADLRQQGRELETAYDTRAHSYRQHLQSELSRQESETRAQAQRERAIDDHARQLQSAWPVALERIGKEKGLTPKQLANFERRAQDRALAQLDHGLGPIEDIHGFIAKEAQAYFDELAEHHREQSALYAQQATQRATQPGSTGAPSGVATAEPTQIKSLEDIHKRARLSLAERLGLR